MKIKLVAAAVVSLAMTTAFAETTTPAAGTTTPATAATPATLTTDIDKLSYSIGADLGKNFKKQGIEISPSAMAKGLQDGMSGSQLLLTEDQMKDVLSKFQKDLMAKRNAEFTKKAEENKSKGEAFLSLEQNQRRRCDAAKRPAI